MNLKSMITSLTHPTKKIMISGMTAFLGLSAGLGLTAGTAHADDSVWQRLAQCESSGNWAADTGNGFYGGLQFTQSTWAAFGGTGNPAAASPATQIAVAQKVLAVQGPGAWPVCSVVAGLTSSTGATSAASGGGAPAAPKAAPTIAAAAPAPTAASFAVHPGDTLSGIAAAHHLSWPSLFAANRDTVSNPNLLTVGQLLRLP